MRTKEDLIREFNEKQKQIGIQKEQVQQLKRQKAEKEQTIVELNQENKAIIENDLPQALSHAQQISPPHLELKIENKEAVLKYVQEQMSTLSREQESTNKRNEKTQKIYDLLQTVQEHLTTGYDRTTLEELTDKSGVTGSKASKNRGFALLLELLDESPATYTWTLDSTDRINLSKAVSKKLNSIEFPLSVDKQTLSKIESASKKLEELQRTLTKNYEERDKLSSEFIQLGQQITQIETVTIKELTGQAEALDRQIKEEERQQQEREKEVKRQPREREKEEEKGQQGGREKERRGNLVIELKELLNVYIKDRNKHYQAKDFFISGDKSIRDHFINELVNEENGLLNAYVNSGSSDAVLKKITEEIDKFPGVKMQATLSKIVVKLMDADSKPEATDDRSEEAKNVLLNFIAIKGIYEEYAKKIQALSAKIEGIKTFAESLPDHEKEEIKQLVVDLKKDVDQFICQNPEKIPGNEAYQKFEMKFKARLHSQDDIMSEYKSSWPEIIANVLLSLVTIGKLIYSKAATGRASFFFDKTENQKQIEAPVDEALKDIRNFISG